MTTTPPRLASPRGGWRVPAGLMALGLFPVLAGALRLVELAGGPPLAPNGERYHPVAPVPLVAHIVAVSAYSVLGALQFAARFRVRRPGWHRAAGRLLVPCGLVGALSALWLALVHHGPDVEPLLTGPRLVFGTAWALFLVLGTAAIRRRDVARHRDWMIRAYAVGLGAGTQVLTLAVGALVLGEPGPLAEALLMLTGWLVNVVVAERVVHRSRRPSPQLRPAGAR